ncbi:MAG: Unknown protein [uncultured Thiotrichaceae bacterium]|uniref:Secreted protein n=1 Tax=uncultured Thiotrichaceae bacterium TaxID=298394 RepID=A0A6S6UE71_9GAMM|nr:MAG: Unknown protein [uncultured Thiotrichaceae bacterium]
MLKNDRVSLVFGAILILALSSSVCSDDSKETNSSENTTSTHTPKDIEQNNDISEQEVQEEIGKTMEETMHEDCANFAVEDGIPEDKLVAYMKSCVEELKQDLEKVYPEMPTN